MTPSLPPDIITTILSHLLPPLPPIPNHLTAKSLFDRLTFLPPDEDNLDAWLTPSPPTPSTVTGESAEGHILGDRLQRLYALGYSLGEVQYSHDGDAPVSRLSIIPLDHPSSSPTQQTSSSPGDLLVNDKEHGVDIMFTFESEERGWVYQSSQIPLSSETDTLSWSSHAGSIPTTPPELHEQGGEITPDEYWKEFNSPKSKVGVMEEAGGGGEGEAEDAYWASYGAANGGGQSGVATRNQSVLDFTELNTGRGDDGVSLEEQVQEVREEGQEDGGRMLYDLPAQGGALDPLAALLATIPDQTDNDEADPDRRRDTQDDSRSSSPSSQATNRATSDLRDKVQARIQSSLRTAWTTFTRDSGESHEDLEIKAMSWLRLGRSVVEAETNGSSGPSMSQGEEEIVVLAKIEVLWDIFTTISTGDNDERKEVFWRLIEGCIKRPVVPGIEEQELTQEMYWES